MNTMLRTTLALAIAAALSNSPAIAAEKAKPAAKADGKESSFALVNGKAIPQNRAKALMMAQNAQGQPDSPELRQIITEELVRREIITQESIKAGFDKKPEVQGQMDLARQGVLVSAYLGDYVRKHPVTEEQIKKEWDDIKAKLGNKEFKARHVLVESEDAAKVIIDKLKKGGKFEDLAKESKDPGSKDRGGDLGWANPSAYVKPFSAALIKLEKGKYTDTPVKSDFGWHVIQLDDIRDLKLPSYEEAKGQINQQLQQRMVQKHVDELRAKAKIE
jgi:peptidyl-prolyl cis-trans isomerase C